MIKVWIEKIKGKYGVMFGLGAQSFWLELRGTKREAQIQAGLLRKCFKINDLAVARYIKNEAIRIVNDILK